MGTTSSSTALLRRSLRGERVAPESLETEFTDQVEQIEKNQRTERGRIIRSRTPQLSPRGSPRAAVNHFVNEQARRQQELDRLKADSQTQTKLLNFGYNIAGLQSLLDNPEEARAITDAVVSRPQVLRPALEQLSRGRVFRGSRA